MPPYRDDPERITYFAETDARGKRVQFGIKAKDRSRHMYVIGKTGMGKSTLLENMAIQDIQNGEGMAFIDPHGSTAEKLLDYVPEERVKDVLYFAPFDMDFPIAFNVMEDVGYDKRHLVVSGLMSAFKKIWVDAWSARMEYILSNTLLALLEYPDSTLLDVNRMYTDKFFRKKVVDNIKDPLVKSFWTDEFANYGDRYTQEATPAIQNKVGQFTSNPLIRNIVGQAESTFDLREMMDSRKIFIANLSKGRVGETNADLLGSMLTTKIYLAAMSRADLNAQQLAQLPNFYFYVDEFQSIANDSFADILSEARKYKLNLLIAHQYIEQMEENVRNAVFGNVGTTVSFRVGPFDAEVLETVFQPTFTAEDLVNLSFAQIYLTLMIDGVGSRPFSARTMAPIDPPRFSYRDPIIENSHKMFARPRADIEAAIKKKGEEMMEMEMERRAEESRSAREANARDAVRGDRGKGDRRDSGGAPDRAKPRGEKPRPLKPPKYGNDNHSLQDALTRVQGNQQKEKQTEPRPVPKQADPQAHLAELRSTLAKIAGENGSKKENKKDNQNEHQKQGKGIQGESNEKSLPKPVRPPARSQALHEEANTMPNTAPPAPPPQPKNNREVPEDVLRKLLDVSKEPPEHTQ